MGATADEARHVGRWILRRGSGTGQRFLLLPLWRRGWRRRRRRGWRRQFGHTVRIIRARAVELLLLPGEKRISSERLRIQRRRLVHLRLMRNERRRDVELIR